MARGSGAKEPYVRLLGYLLSHYICTTKWLVTRIVVRVHMEKWHDSSISKADNTSILT